VFGFDCALTRFFVVRLMPLPIV